jgi:hypothetical protein
MTKRPHRNQSPAFKAKVAVTAINGEKTLIVLAQDFEVHLLPEGVRGANCQGENLLVNRFENIFKNFSLDPCCVLPGIYRPTPP